MEVKFQNVGWKSKLSVKRATFSVSINKVVIMGSALEKGDILYSYLGEDNSRRPIIITYLDGKPKTKRLAS